MTASSAFIRPLAARDAKPAADALTPVLPKVLGKAPEAVQLAALEAIGNLQLREAAPTLVATVADDQAPEAVRVGALKALDTFGGDDVMRGIDAAEKSSAAALRLAALQIVARRAPDRALPIIKRLSTEGSEAEQQAAFQAMGQLKAADTPKLLVAALDQLAAGKVQPGAQLELIESAEASEAPAVKARWAKQQAAWAASGNALAPYSFALAGGAPDRGAGQFFENQVLPCARCHKVGGDGGEAGPDLSLIGAQKKKEYLLEVHHQAERAHRRWIRRGDAHAQERRHRDRLRGERDTHRDRAQARRQHHDDDRSETGEGARDCAVVDARHLRRRC